MLIEFIIDLNDLEVDQDRHTNENTCFIINNKMYTYSEVKDKLLYSGTPDRWHYFCDPKDMTEPYLIENKIKLLIDAKIASLQNFKSKVYKHFNIKTRL